MVFALVVVNGALAVLTAPTVVGSEAATTAAPVALSIPLGGGALRWTLAGAGVGIAALATVAAGLRSVNPIVVAAVAGPAALVYGLTGLVLWWNQLLFRLAQFLLEAVLAVLGRPLAAVLLGGVTLGARTLVRTCCTTGCSRWGR